MVQISKDKAGLGAAVLERREGGRRVRLDTAWGLQGCGRKTDRPHLGSGGYPLKIESSKREKLVG